MTIEQMTPMTMAMSSMSASGSGKARTATTKNWVWATATAIASGASTIAPGTPAMATRCCRCSCGQTGEKVTTFSSTSFWNSRSCVAATTTSRIGRKGCRRGSRYGFLGHGQTERKIRINLRPRSMVGGVGEESCSTTDAHERDLAWSFRKSTRMHVLESNV